MLCIGCGKQVGGGRFCPYCGTPIEDSAKAAEAASAEAASVEAEDSVEPEEAEQAPEAEPETAAETVAEPEAAPEAEEPVYRPMEEPAAEPEEGSLASAETEPVQEKLSSTPSSTASVPWAPMTNAPSNAPWNKNPSTPWSSPASSAFSSAPAAPAQVSEPVTTPEPASSAFSAPASQASAPISMDTPAPGVTTIYEEPKKKNPLLPVFIAVGAVLLVAAIAGGVFAIWHYSRVQRYNKGIEAIDAGNYEEALDIFSGVLDFEDADYYSRMAQVEIDYKKVDGLLDSNDYDGAIKILKTVDAFYGNDEKGKEARSLMYECSAAKDAEKLYGDKDYAGAKSKFDELKKLKEKYIKEATICDGHLGETERDWRRVIKDAYAVQTNDYECKFLTDPQTDEAKVIANAVNNGTDDYAAVEAALKPQSDEEKALASAGVKGIKYEYADKLFNERNYEEAKVLFGELNDFLDSEARYKECQRKIDEINQVIQTYEQAEKYFKSGNYYKAYAAYSSIAGYKDASEKAKKCQQTLPKNGAMKKGSSGVNLTIKNPPRNALIRLYNKKGAVVGQVLLRAGKSATIKVKPGTYTMRIAYGDKWYGSKDLFGDLGVYSRLKNGSSYNFTFKKNYRYTLTLNTWNGNVGTDNIAGGAAGM